MDLRCEAKKHAELEDKILEIKCSSRFCGAGPGVVVLHRFDSVTGELKETLQFKDPARKGNAHAARNKPSVRAS